MPGAYTDPTLSNDDPDETPIPLKLGLRQISAWLKFFMVVVAALSIVGTIAVTQFGIATAQDVEKELTPLEERVESLEDFRRNQEVVNRCLVWDVDPETCEDELGRPIPRPGSGN